MDGYLLRDGLPPDELLAHGRIEVKGYGGEIVSGSVTEVVLDGRSGFRVLLADGERISARRLLVTTGLRDELPAHTRPAKPVGTRRVALPSWHGHEVRDRPLGVLGGTRGAALSSRLESG